MVKFLVLLVMSWSVMARDLGVFGPTFAIIEEDLLAVIQGRLNKLEEEGLLAKAQQQIQAKVLAKLKRPQKVDGITKTIKAREFFYDPSIVVPHDLKDHKGTVFQKAGTRINPLNLMQLRSDLIFIDGDDPLQVSWGMEQKAKIILVSGAPIDLINKHQQPFYFDQQGILVKKLGIAQVPARVSQAGQKLKVEELEVENLKKQSS